MNPNQSIVVAPYQADVLAHSGAPDTPEQRLGQVNYYTPSRLLSPEDANADSAFVDPADYHRSELFPVPCVSAVTGQLLMQAADYNDLANFRFLRAARDIVGALGVNDQTNYAMPLAGTSTGIHETTTTPFAGHSNLILGVQLQWGVSQQYYSPFTMTVETAGAYGHGGQSVDRRFELRFEGVDKSGNGGTFIFPFAYRLTTDKYVGSSSLYGRGGMNKGIVCPAYTAHASGPLNIKVTVPVALETVFNVSAHLVSAASTFMAAYSQALRLDREPTRWP